MGQTPDIPKIGSAPPTRSARAKCWAARDEYFSCLGINNLWVQGYAPTDHQEIVNIDPRRLDIPEENDQRVKALPKNEQRRLFACKQMKRAFEKECLPSWVYHFSMLRVKDLQTEYLRKKAEREEMVDKGADNAFWERVSTGDAKK
ncbi:hypothetical protein DFS34DRAFT_575458 [Phlyctochytrium arcticum]|nr:hypothetical protein DFS34DRAFT_575458 [Phlyctochytrium arcticum]